MTRLERDAWVFLGAVVGAALLVGVAIVWGAL